MLVQSMQEHALTQHRDEIIVFSGPCCACNLIELWINATWPKSLLWHVRVIN